MGDRNSKEMDMRLLSCLFVVCFSLCLFASSVEAATKYKQGAIYDLDTDQLAIHIDQRLQVNKAKKKRTLIFVYASWCPTCQKDMPELIKFARNTNTDIIAISTDKNKADLHSFLVGMYRYMNFPALRVVDGGKGDLRSILLKRGVMYPLKVPYKAIYDQKSQLVDQGQLNLKSLEMGIHGIPRALKSIYEKAREGEVEAMYRLAFALQQKNAGYPHNYNGAFTWYNRAAVKGHEPSLARLAYLIQMGWGTKKDIGKANKMLLSLAPHSSKTSPLARAVAQYILAINYHKGIGVKKNLNLSYFWTYSALKSQQLTEAEKAAMMRHLANLRTKVSAEWQQKIEKDVVANIETGP